MITTVNNPLAHTHTIKNKIKNKKTPKEHIFIRPQPEYEKKMMGNVYALSELLILPILSTILNKNYMKQNIHLLKK